LFDNAQKSWEKIKWQCLFDNNMLRNRTRDNFAKKHMKNCTSSIIIASLTILMIGCGSNDSNNNPISDSKDEHAHHNASFKVGPTYPDSVNEGLIPVDTLKPSVRRVAMANVGDCHVHIEYGSPGVRGRSIWGGLVAYDEVWAAGGHSATSVRFSKPVEINGTKIEAGTYAFFAIPGRESWTLILNTRYKQHLSDEYNAADDVVRMTVAPETVDMVQRLTYKVLSPDKAEATNEGFIALLWENLQVKMPFKVLL
jgi:hypothetical protein